ncbi:DinB family protein [Leadbetterella byssophila]|uniref:DinB family protein n=1 Tax=Leadbetterella byssophila TaxID=316068 RepID=UPI0039A14077
MRLELHKIYHDLLQILEDIPDKSWGIRPVEEVWSISEIVEHILLFSHLPPDEPRAETDRWFDHHVQDLKFFFEDRNKKLACRDCYLPSGQVFQKAVLMNGLEEKMEEIIRYSENSDLTQLCLGEEFTGWGYLTRYEWLCSTSFHVNRHTFQILDVLSEI